MTQVAYSGEQVKQCHCATIENAPQWLIKLFERLRKTEGNVCFLAATATTKDAIEIDVVDIREHDEYLVTTATSRQRALSLDMTTPSLVFEHHFCDIVELC
jgi:hypothetical protein